MTWAVVSRSRMTTVAGVVDLGPEMWMWLGLMVVMGAVAVAIEGPRGVWVAVVLIAGWLSAVWSMLREGGGWMRAVW